MPPTYRFRAPVDVLNYEIVQEQAAALGRLGRGLEAALADLREFDATHPRSEASPEERQTRRTLVAVAGEALWMFVVHQRGHNSLYLLAKFRPASCILYWCSVARSSVVFQPCDRSVRHAISACDI
jgi:hypothetical protein